MIATAVDATSPAVTALTRSLDDLADLLSRTSDETYVWKPSGGVSGSIGAHVRHVLDHVTVLVDGPRHKHVTYDRRERDTLIEQSRHAGIEALRRAGGRLAAFMDAPLDEMLTLEALVEHGQPPIAVRTSLARELVFARQHTIHHQAIIAVLLQQIGVATPSRFGYAPATPTR
jgi:uncharacterized damage-inducible protein DinB